MRLGGPVFVARDAAPEVWVRQHIDGGYGACYLPAEDPTRAVALADAARAADLTIAEVGAWSNTIATDDAVRHAAIDKCIRSLALAEQTGACCCVNIAGSRSEQWDGPHPANLDDDTFDLIVRTVRQIIDSVRPRRTFYTLEPMPWVYPDSPGNYFRLLRAVDRPAFAVHLDVVNMVNSVYRALDMNSLIDECFSVLGPHIKAIHLKDVALTGKLTVQIEERRPGLGQMDLARQLRHAATLDPDLPVLLEHLPTEADYTAAAEHVRNVATAAGLSFRTPCSGR